MLENQMGLFEIAAAPPERQIEETPAAALPTPPAPTTSAKPAPSPPAKSAPRSGAKPTGKKLAPSALAASAPVVRKVSGLVPEGDVRLTANIRLDLHLKLKIASAHRRTTIGEILEELIESHL